MAVKRVMQGIGKGLLDETEGDEMFAKIEQLIDEAIDWVAHLPV